MKTITKLATIATLSFTTFGCSSIKTEFNEAKALDYNARGAVYCGKENAFKYVDMKSLVIIVCEDGKGVTLQKEKSLLQKLFK